LRAFFKYFLAALLALFVFCGIVFLILTGLLSTLVNGQKAVVPARSILVLDLSRNFKEIHQDNPLLEFTGDAEDQQPSLAELLQVLEQAGRDSSVRGIYLVANGNVNGFAASEEIRAALENFKTTGKFIIAHGDVMSQKAYHVANVANRLYLQPKGGIDWRGFSVEVTYFKNLLQKLDVDAQIFYDGRFKSATEPFREERMSAANRQQTEAWLGGIYRGFLQTTSRARNIDTATLHRYADAYEVRTPEDAVKLKLVDGLRYDDEVRKEMKKRLGLQEDDKISFVTPGTYLASGRISRKYSRDRIAVLFAEGEIVYGASESGQIGSDEYKDLLRKIRYNKDIKAVVLRVNSPGGSSLASEIIWREVALLRDAGKPVVVSMGDVAASGGYYIACGADSIFALSNTLTGSIGVFAIVPNMQGFFRNKLGITFDGVKTARYADAMTVTRPLTGEEKMLIQAEVDQIYADFKGRVVKGRKLSPAMVDSIAQGRVWTGEDARKVQLVDALGGLDRAIQSAAALAKLKEYGIRSYPDAKSPLDMILGSYGRQYQSQEAIRKELGPETYRTYLQLKQMRSQIGSPQARWPFDLDIR
jgi:protease-4